MFVHRSLQERKSSNEANWATDGESVMEDISLFRYVSRSLLQLSSHVLMQLPRRLQVLIDTEQYLNSISMVDEHGNIITAGDWAHAPNAAHPDTPPRPSPSQTSEPSVADPTTHNVTTSSSTVHQMDVEDPDSIPPVNNSIIHRRDHHIAWLSYCATVAEFIPSMQDCLGNFDDIRKAIEEGTTSRRVLPRASMKDKGPRK
jgi:hypothetical protein